MGSKMTLQGLQPTKRSFTDLACKSLLLGVNISVMLHEVRQLRESFATINTLIRSLACVHSDVSSEVVSAGEGSATPLTLVTLLPCVTSDMVD